MRASVIGKKMTTQSGVDRSLELRFQKTALGAKSVPKRKVPSIRQTDVESGQQMHVVDQIRDPGG
jgi:hypothetical protein